MKNLKNIYIVFFVALSITSCKKDDSTPSTPTATTGTVEINLAHRWDQNNSTNFLLNLPLVHPTTNDSLTFTTFKYYVSNIKFKKSDGTWWVHPESYFLVDLSIPNSTILSIPSVPTGAYTDMQYTLGVDSLRNVSGAQGGALAVSNNMFWSWNSGYIMMKAEGTSPTSTSGSFSFHFGGFKGTNNLVTSNSFSFTGSPMTISSGKSVEVHLLVNPMNLWLTSPSVSSVNSITTSGTGAKKMATDFYSSISFEHLHYN